MVPRCAAPRTALLPDSPSQNPHLPVGGSACVSTFRRAVAANSRTRGCHPLCTQSVRAVCEVRTDRALGAQSTALVGRPGGPLRVCLPPVARPSLAARAVPGTAVVLISAYHLLSRCRSWRTLLSVHGDTGTLYSSTPFLPLPSNFPLTLKSLSERLTRGFPADLCRHAAGQPRAPNVLCVVPAASGRRPPSENACRTCVPAFRPSGCGRSRFGGAWGGWGPPPNLFFKHVSPASWIREGSAGNPDGRVRSIRNINSAHGLHSQAKRLLTASRKTDHRFLNVFTQVPRQVCLD